MEAGLIIAALTDRGVSRRHNEDAFTVLQPLPGRKGARRQQDTGTLLVVADGLGGHNAGEVASRLAIEALTEWYDQCRNGHLAATLYEAIQSANQRVWEEANHNWSKRGMGTTVVAAVIEGGQATIAHVGDSRAYLIRNEVVGRLTLDHSWVELQLLAGELSPEEAQEHPFRHVITRSLGTESSMAADITSIDLKPGDCLLLCSDGLSTVLDEQDIQHTLLEWPPEAATRRLIELANEKGGPDNITVIVARLNDLT